MKNKIDFYEIYDYYYQPICDRRSFKIIIILLSLFFLGILIFFIIKYFLRRSKEEKMLPWQWAFMILKKLSIEQCISKDDYKKFYFELTRIFKKYLHKRYNWNTEDKTDEELINFLENKKFDNYLLHNLKQVFGEALWIKFADEEVLKFQAQKDLKMIYEVIEKTIPIPSVSK